LFNSIPHQCFLLLKDIDTAGIRREGLAPPVVVTEDTTPADEALKITTQVAPVNVVSKSLGILAWPFKLVVLPFGYFRESPTQVSVKESSEEPVQNATTENAGTSPSSSSGGSVGSISLSGLLNVIDGAASHEGHVLIMTTNTPDKLDDALTRPGRVDLQIGFTLATRDQIRDTYMRMFSNNNSIPDSSPASKVVKTIQTPVQAVGKDALQGIVLPKKAPGAAVELGKLTEIAQQFADALPEVFSPAEIQGYLLMHKTEPEKAIEEVGNWKDETLEAKKKKKKGKIIGGT
jgi:chaperone BCS1